MNRLPHIAAILLLALGMATVSCNDSSCYDNGSSLPLVNFDLDGSSSISGLTIIGIDSPGDSMIAESSTLSEIYLPLRASVNSTSYEIIREFTVDTVNVTTFDTIMLAYEPIPYFHSAECGAMYNFDVKRLEHTFNGIDSVVLHMNTITNTRTPALTIYFTDFDDE